MPVDYEDFIIYNITDKESVKVGFIEEDNGFTTIYFK